MAWTAALAVNRPLETRRRPGGALRASAGRSAQQATPALDRMPFVAGRARPLQPLLELRRLVVARAKRLGPVSNSAAVAAPAVPPGSVSVVLLAGGVGKRMKATMPKQYLPLRGSPIALHSLRTFAAMAEVGEVVVVCDPSYRDLFQSAGVTVPLSFALPGTERQDSVASGLAAVRPAATLVAVHDSARPLVTPADVRAVLRDAAVHGAAVLGVRCKATVKEAGPTGLVTRTLDRSLLWEIQTPQVVRPALLREGFALVRDRGLAVTDDASVVEALGAPVKITEGSYTNLKVTTPEDMLLAERILDEASTTVPA